MRPDIYPDSSVILTAGLRSNAADETGIGAGSFGANQPAFDADNGVIFTSDHAITFALNTIAPSIFNKLIWGGRIKFSIQRDGIIVANAPASAEYLLSSNSGYLRKQTNGRLECRFPQLNTTITDPAEGGATEIADYYIGEAVKDEFIEIIFAWNERNQYLFVDGLPLKMVGKVSPIDTIGNIQTLNFGSLTSTNLSFNNYYYRDLEISVEPYYYTRDSVYGRTLFLGDSFTTQGSPDLRMANTGFVPWSDGFGFDSGGAASAGSNRNQDGGLVAQYTREMIKAGFNQAQCSNEAESGDRSDACLVRAQNFFSGGGLADVACILIGTNNAAGASAVDDDAFDVDIKAIIDECFSNGVKKIVVSTITSLRNFATYQDETRNSNTAAVNAKILDLESYRGNIKVVDNFTLFGGHDFDSADFESNDIHPSYQGSTKFGQNIARGLIEIL